MKKLFGAVMIVAAMMSAAFGRGLEPGALAVGRTNILCVKAPCPWRGITGPGDGLDPQWSSDVLPIVVGTEKDRARITKAWDDLDCVLVDGEFDGVTLTVRAIIGGC